MSVHDCITRAARNLREAEDAATVYDPERAIRHLTAVNEALAEALPDLIVEAREAGSTWADLSSATGIGASTLSKWIRDAQRSAS